MTMKAELANKKSKRVNRDHQIEHLEKELALAEAKACNEYDEQQKALSAALAFVVAVKIVGQKGAPIYAADLPAPFSLETQLREALHP